MEEESKHIFTLSSRRIYRSLALLVFIITVLLLGILQRNYSTDFYGEKDINRFEKVLQAKEELVEKYFNSIIEDFANADPFHVLDVYSPQLEKLAEQEDIFIFYYHKGQLVYWADHTVPLRSNRIPRVKPHVYQTENSTYITENQPTEDGLLYALILIKTEYPYENAYLENRYAKDFKLDPGIEVQRQPAPGLLDIKNKKGEYLFSLDLEGKLKKKNGNVTGALIILMLSVISLFWYFSLKTDSLFSRLARTRWLIFSSAVLVLISFIVIYLEVPRIVFDSDFFKPGIFASLNLPSLGHLWMFTMLIFMISLLFYWFFDRSRTVVSKFKLPVAYLIIILASLWFVYLHHMSKSLVLDSTISFEAYKLDTLSFYTFTGMIILLMAFMVFFLLLDKAVTMFNFPMKKKDYYILFSIGLAAEIPFVLINYLQIEIITPFFFLAFLASMIYLRSGKTRLKFSRFFLILLLLAILTTIDLQHHTSEKLKAQKEIELAKLSSEHDVVAEMLFTDLTRQLETDSLLISRLSYPLIEADMMFEYLQRTYFSGYWTKYDMQITFCRPPDSVYIEQPANLWYPCYTFFDELVGTEGIKINDSEFYFLNNLTGRISYLGSIPYNIAEDEITLFIELNSKIISEELGYPSLLMRENQEPVFTFSYAKFNKGKLITSRGPYNYRLRSDYYTQSKRTFENFRSEGYDHTIFNVDPENSVIVSIPVVSLVDRLISFSYIFAFIFAVFSLSYLLVSAPHLKTSVTWDFKNKIQYSVIAILFLTFLVICTGTIYFVIQQYRMKHQDNLENTMRSLYIELIHKVEYEEDLRNWSSEGYYNLDELLRKFSNVFYTDINLYDKDGMLLATSRSEIYERQLLSIRMNREAFERLSEDNYSAYIHTEKIGKMAYQSAYVPLLNSDNRFLAYLNLPYFTQPEILAQEVSNLVVAILNTYVILLLFILFLSVFLADRITQPLRFIQSRIAQLSLSKTNEKIVYKGRDEIAGLVDEYNYMVDELVKSAELLAQSERESAWREMAKQIAHEIKNPLTPMKLNVQHMMRMIAENADNIEEQVQKVSETLIEQIDSLTSIANEFSDFAKMPKAKTRKINLVEKLTHVVNLFENSEGLHIELKMGGHAELYTIGDPEQFQRVIINLVKNGIQSIPEKQEKRIRITLEDGPESTAIISVSDNGKGIPESIQDKLFQPNFTTKSGGMGMGLAISSNIIKSMDGNIWYSTRAGQGTTFFVKVPVA